MNLSLLMLGTFGIISRREIKRRETQGFSLGVALALRACEICQSTI